MDNYSSFQTFENPIRGMQANNFTTNAPKILDLKSSSKQIFSENCRWVPLTITHALATVHNFPTIITHLEGISHVSKWNNIFFVIINQQCWLSRVKCTVSTVFMKRVQPSLKYKMITQVTHFHECLSLGLLHYRCEK